MSWIESFTLVMRSSVTSLREKVEDPERMIHQLVIDMEEEHDRVRQSVAGAIADEILLHKRVDKARAEAREWMERAAQGLRNKDEAASKGALEHKALATQRADNLEEEHRQQKEQTASLQRAVRDLDDKIRQAKQKQTLLLARLSRAQSQRRVDGALRRADSRSAFAQFGRLEDRVDREEAMCEAYDRLEGHDPDADELKRKFEEQERREQVEKELEELKQRVEAESNS
ncbi:MAG: PspA/IM30 family protein [Myxococcota bacterium]